MGLYILPQENIAVSDVVYLFARHDSTGNKVWGDPIIVWEGDDTEYLVKYEFY